MIKSTETQHRANKKRKNIFKIMCRHAESTTVNHKVIMFIVEQFSFYLVTSKT